MDSRPKNFRSAIDEIDKIDELERNTDNGGHDFKARLEQELHKIEDTLSDLKTKYGDEFKNKKNMVENEVKNNPWAAIGIVALVFLILGMIFSPRGRNRD